MPVIANNAETLLASELAIDGVVVVVDSTAAFPAIEPGSYIWLTIFDAYTAAFEIVKATSKTGTTFTVERAQDGTLAQTWVAGGRTKVANHLVAAQINDFAAHSEPGEFTAAQGFSELRSALIRMDAEDSAITTDLDSIDFSSGSKSIRISSPDLQLNGTRLPSPVDAFPGQALTVDVADTGWYFPSNAVTIPQVAHGLSKGQPLAYYSGAWRVADATLASHCAIGVCGGVVDADHFVLVINGLITGLSGLVAGAAYYVGAGGALVTTPPPELWVNPVGFAVADTALMVLSRSATTGNVVIAGAQPVVGTLGSFHWTVTTPRQVFSGADDVGNILRLQGASPIVAVNGVMLVNGVDFAVDVLAGTVTFSKFLAPNAQVQIMPTVDPTELSSFAQMLDDLPAFDGTTATFPLRLLGAPFTPANAAQLEVHLNGFSQRPFVDYTTLDDTITFTVPPETDATRWVRAGRTSGELGGGTQGEPGTQILSGNVPPTGADGRNGDFYIDLVAHWFYGPKAAGVWPAGFSMSGGGSAGAAILSGTVNPVNGQGANGDFYLNYVTQTMFGPKAAGAWPAGVLLKGTNGLNLLTGVVAPTNAQGVNGEVFIDTVGLQLYGPKAAGAWPLGVSIKGSDGLTILNGTVPPNNANGRNGDCYLDTVAQRFYVKAAGSWGTGTVIKGTDGLSVLHGTVAPVAGDGRDGEFWIETSNSRLYGPKAAGAWPTAYVSMTGSGGTASVTVGTIIRADAAGVVATADFKEAGYYKWNGTIWVWEGPADAQAWEDYPTPHLATTDTQEAVLQASQIGKQLHVWFASAGKFLLPKISTLLPLSPSGFVRQLTIVKADGSADITIASATAAQGGTVTLLGAASLYKITVDGDARVLQGTGGNWRCR